MEGDGIEAKCFDLLLEDKSTFFRLQIIERGEGFIKSLILDRNASFWLLSTLRDKSLSSTSSFIKRFEGDGKVFVVFLGRNNRGRFVMITKFFGFGRRSTVIIPKGRSRARWNLFRKAFSELLVSTPLKVAVKQPTYHSPPTSHIVFGEKSFSDVVQSSGGYVDLHEEQPNAANPSNWTILVDVSSRNERKVP